MKLTFGLVAVVAGCSAWVWWPRGLPDEERAATLRAARQVPADVRTVEERLPEALREDDDADAVPEWLAGSLASGSFDHYGRVVGKAARTPPTSGGTPPPSDPPPGSAAGAAERSNVIEGERLSALFRPAQYKAAIQGELDVLIGRAMERTIIAATEGALLDLATADARVETIYNDLQEASRNRDALPTSYLHLLNDEAIEAWISHTDTLLTEARRHDELGYPHRKPLIDHLEKKLDALREAEKSPGRQSAKKHLKRVFDGVGLDLWTPLTATQDERTKAKAVGRVFTVSQRSPNLRGLVEVQGPRGPPSPLDRAIWSALRDYFINPTQSSKAAAELSVFAQVARDIADGSLPPEAKTSSWTEFVIRFADRARLHELLLDLDALLEPRNTSIKGDYFNDLRYTNHLKKAHETIAEELKQRPDAPAKMPEEMSTFARSFFTGSGGDDRVARAREAADLAFRSELQNRYPREAWPQACIDKIRKDLELEYQAAASRLQKIMVDVKAQEKRTRDLSGADSAALAKVRRDCGSIAQATLEAATCSSVELKQELVDSHALEALRTVAKWGSGEAGTSQPIQPVSAKRSTKPMASGSSERGPPFYLPLEAYEQSGVEGSLDELQVTVAVVKGRSDESANQRAEAERAAKRRAEAAAAAAREEALRTSQRAADRAKVTITVRLINLQYDLVLDPDTIYATMRRIESRHGVKLDPESITPTTRTESGCMFKISGQSSGKNYIDASGTRYRYQPWNGVFCPN